MKRKLLCLFLVGMLSVGCLIGCGSSTVAKKESSETDKNLDENVIVLSEDKITVNGMPAGNSSKDSVYLSNDIIYYEDKATYESGNPYGEGSKKDRHSREEAEAHTVVNITQAGTYRVQGSLSKGQIRVDLGKEAEEDPNAVVNLILDEVDLTCEVAPAILFLNVYECDQNRSEENASSVVDTGAAGANLIIADDSVNKVSGSYVAKIFKDAEEEKKLWKQDGAIYSYMSMNVGGEHIGTGTLYLYAENEGLDTELHLSILSGNIHIYAQNDGINTNEDGVSVTTIHGGNIHIIAGLGEEGDGIDSNGWLVINGGTVIASANPAADAGLDSDMGSFINGGTVVALGSTMDWAESDSDQVTMNLQFASYQESDSAIVIRDENGQFVFAYDPSEDEVLGEKTRKYMGAIISCSNFHVEDTYQVFIGGKIDGTELAGVYDPKEIKGYDGGTQQAYTGTDVMMRPMGGFGGGREFSGDRDPEGATPPKMPEGEMPQWPGGKMPEGEMPQWSGGKMPEGEMPQWSGGKMPEGEMPQWPGGKMPEGEMPQMPGSRVPQGDNAMAAGGNELFYMQDKVNYFSGVAAVNRNQNTGIRM